MNDLFQAVERQYDLILSRRNTLNSQASNLMSFAGIINTVLVGLLIGLGTNPNAKTLLMSNPYFQHISLCMGVGFVMYIFAASLSLSAFIEVPWIPAPQVIFRPSAGETEQTAMQKLKEELDGYQKDPKSIPVVVYELQLATAILSHLKTNKRKYYLVLGGFLLLIVGIIFTALGGLLLLIGSL